MNNSKSPDHLSKSDQRVVSSGVRWAREGFSEDCCPYTLALRSKDLWLLGYREHAAIATGNGKRPPLTEIAMTDRRLTEPQRKALFWLVPGKVCGDAPRDVSAALNSLKLYHPDLVTCGYKQTPRGRTFVAYELTEVGATERAKRMDQQ